MVDIDFLISHQVYNSLSLMLKV